MSSITVGATLDKWHNAIDEAAAELNSPEWAVDMVHAAVTVHGGGANDRCNSNDLGVELDRRDAGEEARALRNAAREILR